MTFLEEVMSEDDADVNKEDTEPNDARHCSQRRTFEAAVATVEKPSGHQALLE